MVFIRGIPESDVSNIKYLKPIRIFNNSLMALVLSIEQNQIIGLLLNENENYKIKSG